ncbi:hypothetical protein ACOSP7_003053 [Xanthoceras sorbifolium]
MEIDRLSNLPDTVIFHEVLSRLDTTKEAVKTCVLSKNWTHHWSHVHTLSFDYKSFKTTTAFEEFVLHVLQHRQQFINLPKLRFFCGARQSQSLINGVFNHATLCELEELETDVCDFPQSLLECQTLKTLHLGRPCSFINVAADSLNFAWLKNLQLFRVTIDRSNDHNDLFSGCLNLENLGLTSCQVSNTEIFKINAPRLVQCLIIDIGYEGLIDISAPELKRLKFKGTYPLVELRIDNNITLDEVKLEMSYPLFSRETNTWKEEPWEYIILLAQWLRSLAKIFFVSFNFYVGEIKLFRDASDEKITFVEQKKDCNGHLTDLPWN